MIFENVLFEPNTIFHATRSFFRQHWKTFCLQASQKNVDCFEENRFNIKPEIKLPILKQTSLKKQTITREQPGQF